jgi:hypothetical protein
MRDLRAAAAPGANMMPVAIARLRGACDAALFRVMALIGIMRGIESLAVGTLSSGLATFQGFVGSIAPQLTHQELVEAPAHRTARAFRPRVQSYEARRGAISRLNPRGR